MYCVTSFFSTCLVSVTKALMFFIHDSYAVSTQAAAVEFRWSRNSRSLCTVRCQCTLKNLRWSKFPEPFTTASLIA
uniref:Putative secreted protein n=1 Tax=Amblyomma cajennense TaxID=34607 RepID=A0A023FB62_AMBCJ